MKTSALLRGVVTDDGGIYRRWFTHTQERKSLKQPRLPQGRAFVLPRKHGGLDPERLPAEKQRRGNLEAFMSAGQERLLGRRRS